MQWSSASQYIHLHKAEKKRANNKMPKMYLLNNWFADKKRLGAQLEHLVEFSAAHSANRLHKQTHNYGCIEIKLDATGTHSISNDMEHI